MSKLKDVLILSANENTYKLLIKVLEKMSLFDEANVTLYQVRLLDFEVSNYTDNG